MKKNDPALNAAVNARRQFLKSAAWSAVGVSATALPGCVGPGGDSASPASPPARAPLALGPVRALHFAMDFPDSLPEDEYTLHLPRGAKVSLSPHTALTLATLSGNAGLASAKGAYQATHYAQGVQLPSNGVARVHVTRRTATMAPGARQMAVVHISVPAADLQYEMDRVDQLRASMGLPARSADQQPPYALAQAYGVLASYVDTAVSIVYHHPELMSFEKQSAATVLAHINSSSYLPALAMMIKRKPLSDGTANSWCLQDPVISEATGLPLTDANGNIIYDCKVTDEIMGFVRPVLTDVLRTVKADLALQDKLWSSGKGLAAVPVEPPARLNAGSSGYRLATSLANGWRADGVTFDVSLFDASKRSIKVVMYNAFLRYHCVAVQFKDATGRVLSLSDAEWDAAFNNTGINSAIRSLNQIDVKLQDDKLQMLDLLAPTTTVFAIPVKDGSLEKYITLPPQASSATVALASLGVDSWGKYPWADVLGVTATAGVNYGMPTLFLALAAGETENASLLGLLKSDVGLMFDFVSQLYKDIKEIEVLLNPNSTEEQKNTARANAFGESLHFMTDIADRLVKLLGNKTLTPKLLVWLLTKMGAEELAEAVPFVGWVLRAVSVAANIASITETTVEVLSSSAERENTISIAMDLSLSMNWDLDDFQWPATATHYQVQVWQAGQVTRQTDWTNLDDVARKGTIVVPLKGLSSGGSCRILVIFKGAFDVVVGKGYAATYQPSAAAIEGLKQGTKEFAAIPATIVAKLAPLANKAYKSTGALVAALESCLGTNDATTYRKSIAGQLARIDIALLLDPSGSSSDVSVECTIQEQLVLLTPKTSYIHKRVLQYGGGAYWWLNTAQARAVARPTCDNAADALCELSSITVAQRSGQLGYAWRSSSAGLKVCGSSAASTQVYTVQNISLGPVPGAQLRSLTQSGQRCGIIAGAGVVYQMMGPVDGSGANFLLDGRADGVHVRPLNNTLDSAFELNQANQSFGTFPSLPTAVVWHPAGYVIGVYAAQHKIAVINVNKPALSDWQARPAVQYGGLGNRAGLIRQPVCIAATLSSVFLVLEAGAGRVQAFDVQGQPYFGYATGTASWFSLKDRGSTVQYLDMGVEAMGYVYVLSRINNGLNASDYNLDIYTPAGDWVCATNGFTAARMTVDLWRNVHTLNWETLRGQDGRTEPTVSEWVPGTAG